VSSLMMKGIMRAAKIVLIMIVAGRIRRMYDINVVRVSNVI
jgi:hypothetical protein